MCYTIVTKREREEIKMIRLTEEQKDAWRIISLLMDEWSEDNTDPELADYACRTWSLMYKIFSTKLEKSY